MISKLSLYTQDWTLKDAFLIRRLDVEGSIRLNLFRYNYVTSSYIFPMTRHGWFPSLIPIFPTSDRHRRDFLFFLINDSPVAQKYINHWCYASQPPISRLRIFYLDNKNDKLKVRRLVWHLRIFLLSKLLRDNFVFLSNRTAQID